MIVVDTNILAYLYLPSEWTPYAEKLLVQEPIWVAPTLWRSEFRNILAGFMRRGTLMLDQAQAIQAEAEYLLAGQEYTVHSDDVLQRVQQSECSAYDCEFVALAVQLRAKLFTMDKKVLRNFDTIAFPLRSD